MAPTIAPKITPKIVPNIASLHLKSFKTCTYLPIINKINCNKCAEEGCDNIEGRYTNNRKDAIR